ncbi:MAG: helix-turn-helix domain-containing protein [Planctomycetaceae bacterium]
MPPPTSAKIASSPETPLRIPENAEAYTAFEHWGTAREAGEIEPVIFLSGPAGCGKSLLVRWGVRQCLSRHPKLSSLVLTAADFAAQFAEASANQTIPLFQTALRELDLLVVEDLQTLQGRGETLTQLLNLMIALREREAAMAFTANCPPGGLAGFPPRLVSRLRGGISVRLTVPGPESRLKILLQLARGKKLRVSREALVHLANQHPVTPRELGGVLSRLESMSRQHRRPLDLELVRRYLEREAELPDLTLQDIAREVAAEFGLKLADLRSSRRTRELAFPRQVGMWLSRQLLGESLLNVGRFYGGRDHTTVGHACQKVAELLASDGELPTRIERIRRKLRREV